MSTQYETQGYTINNAGRRLVVDPITRIEGHMRCEVNINDQNVITNAVSCGTCRQPTCSIRPVTLYRYFSPCMVTLAAGNIPAH